MNFIRLSAPLIFACCFASTLHSQWFTVESGLAVHMTNYSGNKSLVKDVYAASPCFGFSHERELPREKILTFGYALHIPRHGFHVKNKYDITQFKYKKQALFLHTVLVGYGLRKGLNSGLSAELGLRGHIGWSFNASAHFIDGFIFFSPSRLQVAFEPRASIIWPLGDDYRLNVHAAYMQGVFKIQDVTYDYWDSSENRAVVGTGHMRGSNFNFGIGLTFDLKVLNR